MIGKQKMAVRAMKNWRDSSGIIVLSGALKYARAPTLLSKLGDLGENPLIVPLEETGKTEWEVALVKRSSKTGFFGNSLSLSRLPVLSLDNRIFPSQPTATCSPEVAWTQQTARQNGRNSLVALPPVTLSAPS